MSITAEAHGQIYSPERGEVMVAEMGKGGRICVSIKKGLRFFLLRQSDLWHSIREYNSCLFSDG